MSFRNIVAEAKKNTPPLRKPDPSKPVQNIIDATEVRTASSGGLRGRVNWEKCLHKHNKGGQDYCSYFMSRCAKDKCDPKFME